MTKPISSIPATIAGAAVMSFGFSLGRDLYSGGKKAVKKSSFAIFMVLFTVVSLVATYLCAQYIARNYKTLSEIILWRLGSSITLCFFLIIGFLPVGVLFSLLSDLVGPLLGYTNKIEIHSIPRLFFLLETTIEKTYQLILGMSGSIERYQFADDGLSVSLRWIATLAVFALGFARGLGQRKARRLAWEAQSYNEKFMQDAGLAETGNGEVLDSAGQRYRVENANTERMELFAIGRRNKRGYLYYDQNGKISNWTGLVIK